MKRRTSPLFAALVAPALAALLAASGANASTYVVQIPLDSPIYDEIDSLDGLGLLDSYLSEIRPISRVEAARLTLEAEHNLATNSSPNPLAVNLLRALHDQLRDEIGWLEKDSEDSPPTVMVRPIDRAEAQFVYSRGARLDFSKGGGFGEFQAREETPLLPNNDALPTSSGSNEVARASGWAGLGTFVTAYGEGALAGPLTYPYRNADRARLVRGALVLSLGNVALSAGEEEMAWGTGYFAALSQGNNARPFPALRIQNIHPSHLPGFLRYLGPYRAEAFFGQLDHHRDFSRPWFDGEVIAFKPLPGVEFGFDHVVMFGGRGNDNYSAFGFLGRAVALGTRTTGNSAGANTNQRAGIFAKFHLLKLRNTIVYQETLAEDNIGDLPIAAVSYQGGVYVPQLTRDGLTTARFEYALTEANYSTHDDSLDSVYKDHTMGDPIGPDASQVNLQIGRWLNRRYKADLGPFYTERAPRRGLAGLHKEHAVGVSLDVLRLPATGPRGSLWELRMHGAVEWVNNINFSEQQNAFRATISLTVGIVPAIESLIWN